MYRLAKHSIVDEKELNSCFLYLIQIFVNQYEASIESMEMQIETLKENIKQINSTVLQEGRFNTTTPIPSFWG